MKSRKKIYIILLLILLIAIMCGMVMSKRIINTLVVGENDIIGVDISHYQGMVDIKQLKKQDVEFVYIKATEGSKSVDDMFLKNWENAKENDIYYGAYHFFSFDSDGKKQAKHFIDTVGTLRGALFPVVDIEYYGNKEANPPDKEMVKTELTKYLEELESQYNVKPVIYTTQKVYIKYIRGEFEEYPLWIRSVYYPVKFVAGNDWAIWQYSDSELLNGYGGDEKYIDMNIINRSIYKLEDMLCP